MENIEMNFIKENLFLVLRIFEAFRGLIRSVFLTPLLFKHKPYFKFLKKIDKTKFFMRLLHNPTMNFFQNNTGL